MAMTLATVAVTAVVVGVITAFITRDAMNASFRAGVGARPDTNPVDEHHRKLAAANLEISAAVARADLLRLALDALSTGVFIVDRDGRELARNRLARRSAEEASERTLIEAAVDDLLALAISEGSGERELEMFGPPKRTLFIHAAPITSEGQTIGALAVVDDVTDIRQVDKTRRDFVANLSHELRTPVGAASLIGEMLVDEQDVAVRRQLTERLLIETERMTDTIDDLLALSRIESSDESFDDVVAVQWLIEEAVERTRVAAEASQVTVGTVLPSDQITLLGNEGQLLAAVVNLVENAIKYSSPGDSVSVRGRSDGDLVHLAVQDTGRGIPKRDLDRIFERFYRVDRSRNSETGGTGIGLSIVRHVALNHGGTVEVSSVEGDGSTFTMVLPHLPATTPGHASISGEAS